MPHELMISLLIVFVVFIVPILIFKLSILDDLDTVPSALRYIPSLLGKPTRAIDLDLK